MDALVKGSIGAAERIERECAKDVGCIHQGLGSEEGQHTHCQHRLRGVAPQDVLRPFFVPMCPQPGGRDRNVRTGA